MLKSDGVILDCFGAEEWQCYFGLFLVLNSDDVI